MVAIEATGRFEVVVAAGVAGAGLPIVVVNPAQVRAFTTAGFRAKNRGMLGRSNGCVVVDPVENNQLVTRLQDGALVYVTVGDALIEQYL